MGGKPFSVALQVDLRQGVMAGSREGANGHSWGLSLSHSKTVEKGKDSTATVVKEYCWGEAGC